MQQKIARVESEDPFKSRVLNSSHEAFMMNNTSTAMHAKIADMEESKNQSSSGVKNCLSFSEEEDKQASHNLRLELSQDDHMKPAIDVSKNSPSYGSDYSIAKSKVQVQ